MLKNNDELKQKLREELSKRADEFIDDLDTEEFTIDTIEDIMTRFSAESKEIMIDTVNDSIASFDEKEIINKKNEKLKD